MYYINPYNYKWLLHESFVGKGMHERY